MVHTNKRLLFFIVMIATFFIAIHRTEAASTLNFQWEFNEGSGTTATDSSGNGFTGTLYNSPTYISGGGLSFNGTNQYVRSDAALANSIGRDNEPYSISVDVRVPSGETDGDIVHIADQSSGIGWCLPMVQLLGNKFKAVSWKDSFPVTVTDDTTITNDIWYNVVHTWDPTGGLRLYVNGVLEASTPMNTFDASGTSNYIFVAFSGVSCSNESGWFRGDVRDVRIYSDALTQDEINVVSGIATPTPSPSPTPTPTNTPTPTPTNTPVPTPTNTPVPTATPTPTSTPTSTPTPTTVPETTPSQAQSASVRSTQQSSTICTDSQPVYIPDVFQITSDANSFTVYFAPVSLASQYIIWYGESSNANEYSATFEPAYTDGVLSYTVSALQPGKKYYVRVQGKNGCKTGLYSVTKEVYTVSLELLSSNQNPTSATRTITMQNRLRTTVTPTPQTVPTKIVSPTQIPSPIISKEGYELSLRIMDGDTAVAGATVEVHSTPRTGVTDKNGNITFLGVEAGEHTVYVSYEGFTGEEKINLKGDQKDIALNIAVELKPGDTYFSKSAIGVITLLVVTILLLLVRKKTKII